MCRGSDSRERRKDAGVLVETSSHADRVCEAQAKKRLRKARIVRFGRSRIKPKLKALDRELMGEFGVERLEQSLTEAEKRIHGASAKGRR